MNNVMIGNTLLVSAAMLVGGGGIEGSLFVWIVF